MNARLTRFRSVISAVLLMAPSAAVHAAAGAHVELHLAPGGQDANPGTAEKPLATFAAAQRAVRAVAGKTAVTVWLHGGTYYLPETVRFTAADSGTAAAPVVYAAAPGEKPVISGGTRLELQWKPFRAGVFQAKTPAGLVLDQLFIDGRRQPMARYPNYDPGARQFNGTAADAIAPERVARWREPAGGYIHAMHEALWGDMHWRILGKKPDGSLDYEGGWQNNRPSGMHPEFRFVENVREELDAPGEWFHDAKAGILYFFPPAGTELKTATVEAVRLRHLVEFNGSQAKPVAFITLRGLTFRHAARTFMDNREPLLRSDWTTYRGGAVLFSGAEDAVIEDCDFDQLGGNTVFVNNYNRRITVRGCLISESGANGVAFVGDPKAVRDPQFNYDTGVQYATLDRTPGPRGDQYPADCLVEDCLITRSGRFEKQTAPVQIAMAQGITVRHCSIYDVPRAGINIGDGCWGGHLIEFCDVFDTVMETDDHGSFNSWGRDRYWKPEREPVEVAVAGDPKLPYLDACRQSVLRYNRWRCDHGWDVDLDDGSSHYAIHHNVFLCGGLKLREGFGRIATNNVFVNSSLHPHVWYPDSGDVFARNIVMGAYQPAIMGEGKWGKEVDSNLFTTTEDDRTAYAANGCDAKSQVGEAMFVDAARGDFRVKAESPALKLGFVNFPMDRFGVRTPRLKAMARTPEIPPLQGGVAVPAAPDQVAWQGATLRQLAGVEFSAIGVAADAVGAFAAEVPGESGAFAAGLRRGDLIQQVNEQPVRNAGEFIDAVGAVSGEQPLNLKMVRRQQSTTLTIKREASPPQAALHAVEVTNLRCEYRTDPLGLDVVRPQLSWQISGSHSAISNSGSQITRSVVLVAYQLLVASTPELLAQDQGDLWDSGKVESDQNIHVEYAGKPLVSRMRCHWKVRVWTSSSLASGSCRLTPSSWSQPARWTMGLLNPADWQAKWIGLKQPALASSGRTPLNPAPLRIVGASYQAISGCPAADVTARVAAQVRDNTLFVVAGNDEMGGDPAEGTPKRLVVEYELAGRRQTAIAAEGESLAINCDHYGDEEAKWSRPGYLRKEFRVDGAVRRATAHATALGLYELRLNGQRVGDQLLAPEWTDYHARVQVQTYDVTSLLRSGTNAIGATLGNGWYCGGWQFWQDTIKTMYGTDPSLLVQVEIEFADGRRQTVVTDTGWRGTTEGPLRFAGIYEGVTVDARREMPGWDKPGFDDSKWVAPALRGADLKVGKLVWPRGQPIRVTREIKPVAVVEVRPGVHVFAFGQNMVGHCRFTFRGRAGETLEIQHGEMRNPDGTVFLGNLLVVSNHRIQLDRYTFCSDAVETFEPVFTYHGFQFVEVRGLSEKPALDSVVGVVVNSDCPESGEFTCSDPLVNRLAQNILWSQRGNYMGVPTDCPQRNERCGYTGDAQFFMRTAVYNMDVSAFFNKWLVDVCQDAQMPDGHIADRAPHYGTGDSWYIGWGDAGIICPYEIYRTYGDTRVVREHYAAMKRYLEAMNRNSQDGLFTGSIGGGDWLETGGGVADDVMGTAYLALDTKLMAEMAEAIGETRDAAVFRERFAEIAKAFATAYLDADGNIKASSQSGYALAFTIGLVPPALREKMSARFAQEAHRFDWHPRTGFVGTPRLLPGLHLAGRDADAYKLLLTRTAPSWLYPVSVGATTIWEQWEAWDGKNAQGGMNSLNHYSFGAVGEYLFGMVGGIQAASPGYKTIVIKPVIGEGLTWARTRYDSIGGTIVTHWKRDGARLNIEVTIPPNTTATVYVPAQDAADVTESGKPAAQAEGVRFLRMEEGAAVYEVGSGVYRFESRKAGVSG